MLKSKDHAKGQEEYYNLKNLRFLSSKPSVMSRLLKGELKYRLQSLSGGLSIQDIQ